MASPLLWNTMEWNVLQLECIIAAQEKFFNLIFLSPIDLCRKSHKIVCSFEKSRIEDVYLRLAIFFGPGLRPIMVVAQNLRYPGTITIAKVIGSIVCLALIGFYVILIYLVLLPFGKQFLHVFNVLVEMDNQIREGLFMFKKSIYVHTYIHVFF